MTHQQAHTKNFLIVLAITFGLVFVVLSGIPTVGKNLTTGVITHFSPESSRPVLLVRRFQEPTFDIYYANLKQNPAASVSIDLIRLKKQRVSSSVPFTVTLQDTTVSTSNLINVVTPSQTVNVLARANSAKIEITNIIRTASTHLGSFSLSQNTSSAMDFNEYVELEADIQVGANRYTLIDRSRPSNLFLAKSNFTNITQNPIYISSPSETQIIPANATGYSATPIVSAYTLLKEQHLSNTTIEIPASSLASRRFPAAEINSHPLSAPYPAIGMLNESIMVNPLELKRYNTAILKLTDTSTPPKTSYKTFDLTKNEWVQSLIPWKDVADIYTDVQVAFASLNKSSSVNSAFLSTNMRSKQPKFSHLNYQTNYQSLLPYISQHQATAFASVNVQLSTDAEKVLALAYPGTLQSIQQAMLNLATFSMPIAISNGTSLSLQTQMQYRGTDMVLHLLTKQGTLLSKPATAALELTVPSGAGIPDTTAAVNPITNLSFKQADMEYICLVEENGNWRSLPTTRSHLKSPIDCWLAAEQKNLSAYTLRHLVYTPSTQSLQLGKKFEAYTPDSPIQFGIANYDPQTKTGTLNEANASGARVKAVYYTDLSLLQPQEEEVAISGASFTLVNTPSFCSTSCYFRLIYESELNNRKYFKVLSEFIPHNPTKDLNLEFCFTNPEIYNHSEFATDEWVIFNQQGDRLTLESSANAGCLVYQQDPPVPTTTAASSTTARQNFSVNLLTNGDFETDPFPVPTTTAQALPPGTTTSPLPPPPPIQNAWIMDQALVDWNSLAGETNSAGLEIFFQGSSEVTAQQTVSAVPGETYVLTASGLVDAINTVPCRLAMKFLDASLNLVHQTRGSFDMSGVYNQKTLIGIPRSTVEYVRVELSMLQTNDPEPKHCQFDNVTLLQLLPPTPTTIGTNPLLSSLDQIKTTQASHPNVPQGSLLITNIAEGFTNADNPFLPLTDRSVPVQYQSVLSKNSTHQLHWLEMDGYRPIVLDTQQASAITVPSPLTHQRVTALGRKTALIPYNIGSSIYSSELGNPRNPAVLQAPNNPKNPFVFLPTESVPLFTSVNIGPDLQATPEASTPHIIHIPNVNQLFNQNPRADAESVTINLSKLKNAQSTVDISELVKSQVSTTAQSPGQFLSFNSSKQLVFQSPDYTISIPQKLSLQQFTSQNAFLLKNLQAPGTINTVILPTTINLNFETGYQLPETTRTNPQRLQPAITRTQAYSSSLPFASIPQLQNIPYQISNVVFEDSLCDRFFNVNQRTETITGNIPVGLPTLFCDFSLDFELTETVRGVENKIQAPFFFRIPISAAPPLPIQIQREYFISQTGDMAEQIISFPDGLFEVLYDGSPTDPSQNGITLTYSDSAKEITISGTAANFTQEFHVSITARNTITFERTEVSIIVKPKPILNVPITITDGFTQEFRLLEIIKDLLENPQSPSSATTTTTTSTSTTASPITLSNLLILPADIPTDINYLVNEQIFVIDSTNTLTSGDSIPATVTVRNIPFDLTFTITKRAPQTIPLPAVTILHGAAFSLNLPRYIIQTAPDPNFSYANPRLPQSYQLLVTGPRWINSSSRGLITGRAPTFASETLTISDTSDQKVYTLTLTGQATPQPTTTAAPATTRSASIPTTRATTTTTAAQTSTSTTGQTTTTSTTAAATTTTQAPTTTTATHAAATIPAAGCFPDLTGLKAGYEAAICKAAQQSVVEGVLGKFLPANHINRAEATKILIAGPGIIKNITNQQELNFLVQQFQNLAFVTYPDVPGNAWFMPYVIKATQLAIVSGYPNGLYRPGFNINFAEASKLIVNTMLTFAGENSALSRTLSSCLVQELPWYSSYVLTLNKYGGDFPKFYENQEIATPIKRDQFTFNIMNMLSKSDATTAILCEPADFAPPVTTAAPTTTGAPTSSTAAPATTAIPTTSSAPTTTTTQTPTTQAPTTTTQSGTTYHVDIQNLAFNQSFINVSVGDTVIFTNKDSVPHTVTSTDGGPLNSGTLAARSTYSHTFTTAGQFQYRCNIHPSMLGSVTVR
jgi:plastocyanin